jgi:hypothetical protein
MNENKNRIEIHRLYNSPIELAIRTLIILYHHDSKTDIDRLMYLDHLALNTEDIGGPPSIHAPIPHRGVQIFARKELIEKGITILVSKQLISIVPSTSGILYEINEAGKKFLEYFSSEYFIELRTSVKWVENKFNKMTTLQIREFIDNNLDKWGGEFLPGVSNT